MTCNLIVISRLRDERGEEERGNESDGKMRGHSPRASPNGHSPVLNLSKLANEPNSLGAPSERSELHSPNPSIKEDDDNLSDGNVSEVDEEPNDKEDDDGLYNFFLSLHVSKRLVTYYNQFNQTHSQIDFDISFACSPRRFCFSLHRFLISVRFFCLIQNKPIFI